jgi:hypothetical protein
VPRETWIGQKQKKAKLGPSSKLGAKPKLGLFFAQSEFLLVLIKIQIGQK